MGLLVRDKWTLKILYDTPTEQTSTTRHNETQLRIRSEGAPAGGSSGASGAMQSLGRASRSEQSPSQSPDEPADVTVAVTVTPGPQADGGFPTLSRLRKYVPSSRLRLSSEFHTLQYWWYMFCQNSAESAVSHQQATGRGVDAETDYLCN